MRESKPEALNRLIEEGLARARTLGHDPVVESNDGRASAVFKCSRCSLGFVAGREGRRMRLIAATACSTPCGVGARRE